MTLLKITFWILFFIVIYTYVGYGIVLYIWVKIKEKKHPLLNSQTPEKLPDVTLLIAAYNEEAVIEEKMKNTLELEYPPEQFKIVWVTDGSNDKTNEKLSAYPQVTVLHQPRRMGKTAAINRAMTFIHTEITVFTDANTLINKEAIGEMVKCFTDKKVGCVAGEKRILVRTQDGAASGGEGLYWKYESALKALDNRLYSTMGAAGELYAIKTELYEPMENNTLLDDFILSMKLVESGYKIAYCNQAYAIENGSANMEEESKRKIRIAAGGVQSIGKLKKMLNIFRYGTPSFQYISHRVLRWSVTPVALFFMLPINLLLVIFDPSWLYVTFLTLQILFYLMGLGGYYLSTRSVKNKFLYVPYYFLFMNLNVIKGFFYLTHYKGNGTWEKAKRA